MPPTEKCYKKVYELLRERNVNQVTLTERW